MPGATFALLCSFVAISLVDSKSTLAYFPCLLEADFRCQCIPARETIDCANLQLTDIPLPETPMRRYTTLNLSANRLGFGFPSEDQLLESYPQLEFIDLRNNEHLDCRIVRQLAYQSIEILSHCSQEDVVIELPPREQAREPVRQAPPCTTFWCKLRNEVGVKLLRAYAEVHHAWQEVRRTIGGLSSSQQ